MKLGIVGSRNFGDYKYFKKILDPYKDKIDIVVSGGAKGTDFLAEKWADENNIQKEIYKPDWETYGKKAGFIRNIYIVENSDAIVAFQVNESLGTQYTINISKEKGKPIKVFKVKSYNN